MCKLVVLILTLTALLPAQSSPGEVHAWEALIGKLDESGGSYLPFLERRSLSCGIYRLAAGAEDGQSPHARDEVYYVVSGKAVLEVAGATYQASPGAVLFVLAGARHRFVDIEEDLTTLVFFSNDAPTRGGMAAGPRPTEQTPYHEGSTRGAARIFYWFGDGSAGQLVVDHGRPSWNPQFQRFLDEPADRRWRFGENFWTTLDTNIPIEIGGSELDVGLYYLVLENSVDHGLRILALDPDEVRRRRLDAYEANETDGGIAIPLSVEKASGTRPAQRLAIDLVVDRTAKNRATLHVRFGQNHLTAPVMMKPE